MILGILVFACVDNGSRVNEVGGLVGDHLMVHVADVGISKPNIPEIISYCDPKTLEIKLSFSIFKRNPLGTKGCPCLDDRVNGREGDELDGRHVEVLLHEPHRLLPSSHQLRLGLVTKHAAQYQNSLS